MVEITRQPKQLFGYILTGLGIIIILYVVLQSTINVNNFAALLLQVLAGFFLAFIGQKIVTA